MILLGVMRAQVQAEYAKILWNRSKDHGLEKRLIVSDGNSKAYNPVWDVYGFVVTVTNMIEWRNHLLVT